MQRKNNIPSFGCLRAAGTENGRAGIALSGNRSTAVDSAVEVKVLQHIHQEVLFK